MAITLDGAKVASLSVGREDGKLTIQGSYELMSNTGMVLAKQAFNGYSDMKLNMSPETQKLLHEFTMALQTDLNVTLGLS